MKIKTVIRMYKKCIETFGVVGGNFSCVCKSAF